MKFKQSLNCVGEMGKMISGRTAIALFAILSLFVSGIVGYIEYNAFSTLFFVVEMGTSTNGVSQVFFNEGDGYNDKDSYKVQITNSNLQKYIFPLKANNSIKSIRFDPIDIAGVVRIKNARVENKRGDVVKKFPTGDFRRVQQIDKMDILEGTLAIHTIENANDPILELENSSIGYHDIGTDFIKKRGWIIIVYGLLSFLILSGLNYFVIIASRNQYIIGSLKWLKKYRSVPDKTLNKFNGGNPGLAVNVALWIVLLITTIVAFVPIFPAMPATSLDSSWVFGMNQAIAQGFSMGKDIVFSFGPFASIYTRSYHPSTDFMMIGGSLYLALSYWACFFLLIRGSRLQWILALCIIIAEVIFLSDALFFSFPLLVGLTIFKKVFSGDWTIARRKYAPIFVALMFAPFGLISLIKGNMTILCVAIAVLCSVFLIVNKKRVLAIICLVSPMVSMLLFWIASGQSLTNIPAYFISMIPIVSGYTEAMAGNGSTPEIFLYLVSSAFILLSISLQKQISSVSKIFLLCNFFVFLFLAFKAGFVRHDQHAVTSATSILIAALLLPFIFNSRMLLLVIPFSLISSFYINSHYSDISPANISDKIVSSYATQWYCLKNRIKDRNCQRRRFDAEVASMREQANFPVLQGTTDIYSFNQSYLISSGNTWSPRPIFQSYSVYTAALAEINRKHLLGKQAPDNIIFRVEPIDGRVPSIEDGASWPLLMVNYQPIQIKNDFLFLRKKEGVAEIKTPLKLTSETHTFGENVNLPKSGLPIFVQIEIKPTLLGRIAGFLFKPSQLKINIELKNGVTKQYRIIAGMAESGFLLSPLIENTEEFGMLYEKKGKLDEKLVKSFSIDTGHGYFVQWNNEYTVTFSQASVTPMAGFTKIYQFDGYDAELSGSKVTFAEKCYGNIDLVNNISNPPGNITASGSLRVSGWLATSLDKAALKDTVYMVLTDGHGTRSFIKTRRTPRPDVSDYFKNPELKELGFSTLADITALEGRYAIGIAVKQSGKVIIFSQFNLPITIIRYQGN